MDQDFAQFELLRQSIRQAQKTFEAWAGEQKNSMISQKNLHDAQIAEDKENAQALQNAIQKLAQKEAEISTMTAQEKEELAALQAEVQELQKQRDLAAEKKKAMEAEIQNLGMRLESEKQTLAIREESVKRRALDAEKGVEFYQKRLGLKLGKRKNGDMMLSFTQISAAEPLRPFRIAVRVVDNRYEVTGCEPRINGLDQLLARLNETNNFGHFVAGVRRAFQQTVSQS